MAKIFFSMSGEGRGHATRVKAVADLLRDRHHIVIFAPGDAYDLLAPAYHGTNVDVRNIPGLRFVYEADGRLAQVRTLTTAGKYIVGYMALRRQIQRVIRVEKPDLIITDFEPSLPRAARNCGIPFISLNHQHFLIVNDLSSLPSALQWHAKAISLVVRSYYYGQARTIVSSFYFPPLKEKYRNRGVVQVGVILRPSILQSTPTQDGFLLAYLRRFATPNVLEALRTSPLPVKVYGLGERPAEGCITYHRIDESRFVKDLAACQALVCTAGNQLVGEALYLRKPVFAMPEVNNHEQYINAHFLRQEGTGDWVELESFSPQHLRDFLDRLESFRARIVPEKYNGNPLAIKTVEDFLSESAGGSPSKH
ncbi:teichoic acid biosynthesis protein [Candidatus Sumerlaeota bacterium]|nr:teichoic acid biosynthesis protein [Candidatus Sumerlaeota bacterium]